MRTIVCLAMAAVVIAPLPAAAGSGEMFGNEVLFAGQRVTNGCFYRLEMQVNGNLVTMGGGTQLWASNTAWVGAYARLHRGGALAVHDWGNRIVWQTHTWRTDCSEEEIYWNKGICPASPRLRQQNDGNLTLWWWTTLKWSSGVVQPFRAQSCAGVDELKTRVSPDMDRWGGDYHAIELSYPRDLWCGYYCSQDARCKSYTYVPPGAKGPNAMCYLKDSKPNLTQAFGMVSGEIIGR